MTFEVSPRLAADTVAVIDWTLSRVLLMDDRRFPWLILVPRREGLRELHDLDPADRARLVEEISRASTALSRAFKPDKINVGLLGNLVPQLHVHIVARRRDDPAWPGPVWGAGERLPYRAAERVAQLDAVRAALRDDREPHP